MSHSIKPQNIVSRKVELVDSSFIAKHVNSNEDFDAFSVEGVRCLAKGDSWVAESGAMKLAKRKHLQSLMVKGA